MNTFNKNQRRILRGLMRVGLEREAGELIKGLRKQLASARLGCDNLGTLMRIRKMLNEFEHHACVDFDNVSSELRIFRIAMMVHAGLLTPGDLAEFDDEMNQSLKEALEMFEDTIDE